jgi:ferritin-like metal-binding protein YciE
LNARRSHQNPIHPTGAQAPPKKCAFFKEKIIMKLFSANIEDLRSLYVESLQKALDMEQKIVKALPKMVESATNPSLANAFSDHLQQTRGHVAKVETLLREATGKASTTACKTISSLITEAEDGIKDANEPGIRDVTLIAAGQQVEHHEIAVYGTLRNWAEILGLDAEADILEGILLEEKDADKLLTELSESINTSAETVARTAVA